MVTPSRALAAWAVVALAGTSGCTSIALDYTSDGGTPADDAGPDGSSPSDGNPSSDTTPSGGDAGTGPPCPCNALAGMGCCILGGGAAPFCTTNGSACTGSRGVFSACQASDPSTESVCCWNGGPAAGGSTHYASSCGQRPVSCTAPSDCPSGQACQTATCSGMTIGACGVMPACP